MSLVFRANWHVVLVGWCVVCRDRNGKSGNVWGEGWWCGGVPGKRVRHVAVVGVCESGVAENVNGDCDGCPVGSVMLRVNGVDVPDVGENGQNGSWESGADHGVDRGGDHGVETFLMCGDRGGNVAWGVVAVHMD